MRVVVRGRVQGVFFRDSCRAQARAAAVGGFVRNRADGTVEILVSGGTKTVEAFVGVAMRGPAGARVNNVELHNAEPPAEKGFHRRPSV